MTGECDCGARKAASADACPACAVLELGQGLRSGDYGVPARGETEAEYQRRRRRARAAEGWCSVCSVERASGTRPDGLPYRTCEVCRHKARADRDARMRKGQCRHCTKLAQAPTSLCAGHRQRLLDFVNARREKSPVLQSAHPWAPRRSHHG